MPKEPNFLKKKMQQMQQRFGFGSLLTDVAASFLPQFAEQLAKMEKPVSEGGLLKEGETKMAYVLTQQDGQLIITISALTYNRQTRQMIMGQPISNQPLEELLKQQNEENNGGN